MHVLAGCRDAGCGGSWSRAAKYINMEWNQVHLFNEGRKEFARQPQVCVDVCLCVFVWGRVRWMMPVAAPYAAQTHTETHTACLHLVAGLNTRRAKSQNVCAFVLATPTELVLYVVCAACRCVCVCVRWARVQCATFQLMNGQLEKKPPPATSTAA